MIIITGVSRGLGKAIAELYLEKGQHVLGVGRKNEIFHPCYRFIQCDLSDLDAVETIAFDFFSTPVTLINNAGIIGEIKRLSDQNKPDIAKVMTVNVSAPILLTKKVYDHVLDKNQFKLVNISSGAAKRAIPSWAAYCASKAALNMWTETFVLEENEKGIELPVYSVAPGVIDTGMQEEIRNTSIQDFSAVDNFKSMKENDELFSPKEAANRLYTLIERPFSGDVFYDLRNITV